MNEVAGALRTEAEQGFADNYAGAKATLPGAGNRWAEEMRNQAMRLYRERGLPHRRIEEWKYTDLKSLIDAAYPSPPTVAAALTNDDVDAALGDLAALDCHRLVLVNAQFRGELSGARDMPEGLEVGSLSDMLDAPPDWLVARLGTVNPQQDDATLALNTGLMAGGIVIRVAPGAVIAKPVHIVHVHAAPDPASLITRNLVEVADGSGLTLLESHVSRSGAPALTNAVTELVSGKGAIVHHVKVQREATATTHLSTWLVELGDDATYRAFQFSTGGKTARNQVFLRYAGEGADAETGGAVMLRDEQHVDTTLVVDHAFPGGRSRERFKAVLDDEARGVIQCKVIVRRGAQKTDGHQMAQALLLSEQAEFDSKPELEIFADDVVCGHGSTSGQIDEELLFYLRARGIPEAEARALLVAAFVGEAVESIENETVREILRDAASGWLGKRG